MISTFIYFWINYFLVYVLDLIISSPVTSLSILLLTLLLCKIINFTEVVVDSKEQVPKEVRILPNQALPPFYPNGWIPVLESALIKRNEVKSILCFGQELAIARGPSNQIYVFDAYCPHLGANLAVGGVIEQKCNEECIRCPFHAWAFRMSDGNCVDVPYEKNVPNAEIKIWKSLERNNVIFVWYHVDNEEPQWFPEQIDQISSGEWSFKGRSEHFVNCHLQEIPENGADVAHLNQIHSSSVFANNDLNEFLKNRWYNKIVEHEWIAQWSPCSRPNQHMSLLDMININKIFGFKLLEFRFDVKQIGPAYVEIHLSSDICGGIHGVLLQLVKPIGPMRNSIVHDIYLNNSIASYIFSKFFLFAQAKMLQRDIQIWNRKTFLRRPYIGKTEKSLAKYRRWFNQFYSSNSEKICDW